MGKVINWELCKKFKCHHTNIWYIHNPESVLENETHKLPWGFEIQTDHLISTRRPDLVIVNKKIRICLIMNFAVPADHRILKGSRKKDKYWDLAWELKKNLWYMKVTAIPIITGALGRVTKGLGTGTGRHENKWMRRDYPNYSIVKIGQNNEKSPGDFRRLAITHTSATSGVKYSLKR